MATKRTDDLEPGDVIDTDSGEYFNRKGQLMTGLHEVREITTVGRQVKWIYWAPAGKLPPLPADQPRSIVARDLDHEVPFRNERN